MGGFVLVGRLPNHAAIEDCFTVQDKNGKEFVYRVELDGYLHGVVLEKIDKAKYEAALQRETKGGTNGKSASDIKRRARNARSGMERHRAGNGGNLASEGDGTKRQLSTQETDNITDRDLLANAFETVSRSSASMKMITDMERIGDHCTNFAGWVEFSVTGVHKDCQ